MGLKLFRGDICSMTPGDEMRRDMNFVQENMLFYISADNEFCRLGRLTKKEALALFKEQWDFDKYVDLYRQSIANAEDDAGFPVYREVSDQEIAEHYEKYCANAVEFMYSNGLINDEEVEKEAEKKGAPIRFSEQTGDPNRDRIISLRRKLSLSQASLGELLGTTDEAVRGWEKGSWKPSGRALELLELIEVAEDIKKEIWARKFQIEDIEATSDCPEGATASLLDDIGELEMKLADKLRVYHRLKKKQIQ